MPKTNLKTLSEFFIVPIAVLLGIILYLMLSFWHQKEIALMVVLFTIILGSYELVFETSRGLIKKQFALDYIAIVAIIVSLLTGEYLVGAVIALMTTSGQTLEAFSSSQAKRSLTKLINRLPNEVVLWEKGLIKTRKLINQVTIGEEIFVRKGEVIPLDGILISETGSTDESSLTGEPYTFEKFKGDRLRSGTINVGEAIVIRVSKEEKNSTYYKIIEMVKRAQTEKAPFIRLADKYSTIFTLITLAITLLTYFFTHNINYVLAVLVIATPCPLILATPIALMGGVNAAAKKRVIVKKLASLEMLAKAQVLIFDKTGTITLGKPLLAKIDILDSTFSETEILSIAETIERSSLHPLAKAIIEYGKNLKLKTLQAKDLKETIGSGISATIEGTRYEISKVTTGVGMAVNLKRETKIIATFYFEDQIKKEAVKIINQLKQDGLELMLLTGDKKSAAEKIIIQLGEGISFKADCTPLDKKNSIEGFKKQGKVTAMVGDGINDAPALAYSDVGIVFSNEEQTAASEAADIVFLGGDFFLVSECLNIAKRTINIARQSILWGIGASVAGMILAAFGLIPPIYGAVLQEAIDVAVILNALRASFKT